MKVVVFGSIKIRALTAEARQRLDRIMEMGAEILVGDAYGVDAAAQRYLAERGYTHVTVYHRGDTPRNNLGGWATVAVPGSYTDRDVRMCSLADYGLGLWDGSSRGSARNAAQLGKRCRVLRG